MATGNSASMKAFFGELFRLGVYKRSQGRVTRQATFAAILVTLVIGVWRLSMLGVLPGGWPGYALVGLLLVVSGWLSFRIVNLPSFADFLITVEAEMAKVSWPKRDELLRSSAVVMFTIFSLAALILVFDVLWQLFFRWIGVRT